MNDSDCRQLYNISRELNEAHTRIRILEEERAERDKEVHCCAAIVFLSLLKQISCCIAYISAISLIPFYSNDELLFIPCRSSNTKITFQRLYCMLKPKQHSTNKRYSIIYAG